MKNPQLTLHLMDKDKMLSPQLRSGTKISALTTSMQKYEVLGRAIKQENEI